MITFDRIGGGCQQDKRASNHKVTGSHDTYLVRPWIGIIVECLVRELPRGILKVNSSLWLAGKYAIRWLPLLDKAGSSWCIMLGATRGDDRGKAIIVQSRRAQYPPAYHF